MEKQAIGEGLHALLKSAEAKLGTDTELLSKTAYDTPQYERALHAVETGRVQSGRLRTVLYDSGFGIQEDGALFDRAARQAEYALQRGLSLDNKLTQYAQQASVPHTFGESVAALMAPAVALEQQAQTTVAQGSNDEPQV